MPIIDDKTPLEPDYIPDELVDRDTAKSKLQSTLGVSGQTLHLQGSSGTGKTHLLKKFLDGKGTRCCYVSGLEYDTQYKALKAVLEQLTEESVSTGHHTSELQRQLEDQLDVLDPVVVLDDLDFLLLNDGDDLLYFLSRLPNPPQIVVVTSGSDELRNRVESRTYSTLQPRRIEFEPYTGKQVYEILANRASNSLQPRSVHRSAITYIASTTQNPVFALTWLRTAAQTAEETMTEDLVQDVKNDAHDIHTENRLAALSQHHNYLFQAITELSQESGPVIQAGDIYQRYQTVTEERDQEPLSDRRISDFLKHLEHLNLIEAEYHYGGSKGKTRTINLKRRFERT